MQTRSTASGLPRRREWVGGLVVLLCLGGVIVSRGGEPAATRAEPAEFGTYGFHAPPGDRPQSIETPDPSIRTIPDQKDDDAAERARP
jgi:hypothetical protein